MAMKLWKILPWMHWLNGGTEIDSSTIIWICSCQDQDLSVVILGVLDKSVSERQHHWSCPTIQFLGIIHGQCCHIVLCGAQHQSSIMTNIIKTILYKNSPT